MNLSELFLNLSLACFLTIMALTFLNTLEHHSYLLEQKIILEDTAVQALITLEQSISSSRLNYCALTKAIINHTKELNSTSNYQWQNGKLTTYQRTRAIYLEHSINSEQTSLILPFYNEADPWLILDDCNHAILSNIISSTKIGDHYLIALNQATDITLQAPIMVGTLSKTQFYLDATGLHRKINDNHPALIYPNITKISITNSLLTLSAQDHDNIIHLQKKL